MWSRLEWGTTLVLAALVAGCAPQREHASAPPSHEGKTQITVIFTATPDQVPDGDRLFASHAAWMERTHHREGELALLRYNVSRGPELANPLDPGSEPTGNTCYVLMEVYESPAGLEDHWKQGSTNWDDFTAFVEWAKSVKVASAHGSPVIHSLW